MVLTGGDRDATDGVQTVKQRGGIVIAQTGAVRAILPLPEIAPEILRLARLP